MNFFYFSLNSFFFRDQIKQQQQNDSELLSRQFDKTFQSIIKQINEFSKQKDLFKDIEQKLNQIKENIEKQNEIQQTSDNQCLCSSFFFLFINKKKNKENV